MEVIRAEIERNYILTNYVREETYLIIDRLNKTLQRDGLKLNNEGKVVRDE